MVKIWSQSPNTLVDSRMKQFSDHLMNLPWYEGRSFKGLIPDDLTMICPQKPPDFFPHASMAVVSGKLKDILEREQANVEFFRLLIQHKKSLFDNFFIVNFLEVIDCLDKQETVFSDEGLISHSIKRLAVITDLVQGKALFRIAGTILLGVSDYLAAEVENAQCTGVWFSSPEQWRNAAIPSDYNR